MTSQPPDQPWQAPQNVWQQPPYGASPQPSPPPELPKPAGRGLGCAIAAIVAVVVLTVIGGIIWGGVTLYHASKNASTHAGSATSSATKPKPQLQTVDGLNGLLTDIRNHFGDTMGYELWIEPDNATMTRADPSNSRHVQIYYYSGADWSLANTEDTFGSLADLSKFDVTAVIATLTSAPQLLGITDVTKIKLHINGNADGSVTPQIWVEDQTAGGGDAHMDLNPDGSVNALHLSS